MPSPHRKRTTGRRAVTRNRRGETTRAAILAAGQRLLRDKGFEAISVDRVARAAGVTRSSIYHQFHGREEFLLHLIAESLRSLQRSGRRAGRSGAAIDRLLDEAEAGFRGDPNLFRMFYQLVFGEGRHRPEVLDLLREAYRHRTRRATVALAGNGHGGSSREAETLAIVLVAALDGLYARRLIDLGSGRLHDAFAMISKIAGAGATRRRTGQR